MKEDTTCYEPILRMPFLNQIESKILKFLF